MTRTGNLARVDYSVPKSADLVNAQGTAQPYYREPSDTGFYDQKALAAEITKANGPLPGEIADESGLTVAVGGAVTALIDPVGDVDTISVDLVAGRTYLISMQGTGANPLADTFLEIYDPSGNLVDFDDDGNVGTWSLITITPTESGTYELGASAFDNGDGSGFGEYTINVELQRVDNIPDDFTTTATLDLGANFGFLQTSDDVDVYQIDVTGGLLYSFGLAGGADYASDYTDLPPGELDTVITIYDADGNVVASNDDLAFPDDISSGTSLFVEEDGTYFVEVAAYPHDSGAGYALNVTETDISTLDPLDSIDWGTQLPSTHVTVYFAKAGEVFDGNESLGWTQYEMDRAMAALQTWGAVTDLTFSITGNPDAATFKLVTSTSDEFLGFFGPPDTGSGSGIGVFATNGTGWNDTGGLEQGGYGFITLVHEFGHGLGLAHPHDNGGNSTIMAGVDGPFGSYGVFDLNQGVYTTMSYNDGWQLHPDAVQGFPIGFPTRYGYQGGPGAFDIAVVQEKYGADPARNAGNTVYTLPTVNAPGTFWTAIWDSGGIDTIVQAGSAAALIDLTAATLDYSPTGAGVISFVDGVFGGFTIANGVVIENATGGGGDDIIVGNAANNVLIGNAGADSILGRDGNDTIEGGDGNDMIEGGLGNDGLKGGIGADAITGGDGDDIVDGGAGLSADTLDGGAGIDTLSYASAITGARVSLAVTAAQSTGSGNDTISGFENLIGSGFDDVLTGSDGANLLNGGAGNDTLDGGLGDDGLNGGTGIDTASYAKAASAVTVSLALGVPQDTLGAGVDTLIAIENVTGSNFGDTLTGTAGANALLGGGGNDLLVGGLGNDMLDGGAGIDTISYAGAASLVRVNLGLTAAQGTGGGGTDTILGVENVIGSAYNDILTGSDTMNTLDGGDGDDIVSGGLRNDVLIGGAGIDTASYASASGGVRLSLLIATAQSTGAAGGDTLSAIENLIGSAFDDALTGDGGANVLTGGNGNDVLAGGLGNDTLTGGAGTDTASYATATAGVTVSLALTIAQDTIAAGSDTLSSIENLTGSGFADTLTGSASYNAINGGAGSDTVDGGAGNDTIDGGAGNDVLQGGLGNDVLVGGQGNDTIDGGAQNDTITGGVGADTLTGGGGNDSFIYLDIIESRVSSADRITDFTIGDILDLSAIDADITNDDVNDAFVQVESFSGVAGQFTLVFDSIANTTAFKGDVDGDSVADMMILFTGDVTALTSTWVL